MGLAAARRCSSSPRCLRVVAELVSSIRAGLPPWITPYTLRHTCASLLARQGVHPTVAADVLGHDPAVYLRTYAHLYPEDRARAAAALDAARPTGSPDLDYQGRCRPV